MNLGLKDILFSVAKTIILCFLRKKKERGGGRPNLNLGITKSLKMWKKGLELMSKTIELLKL